MTDTLHSRSPLYQAGILASMVFTGFFVGQVIAMILFFVAAKPAGNMVVDPLSLPAWALQGAQFTASIFTFLLPAILTALLCNANPKSYLYIKAFPGMRMLGLICICTLLLSPTVSLTGYFNVQVRLPESMAVIEAWIQSMEEAAAALVQKMMEGKGAVNYLINLFVIAIVAGVTEEFLFRGALLQIVRQKIKNHHAAIWIVAILFSVFHLQFYGFIPRMILGAYLGYLVYWTKSIWVPVFAHFLHNAVAFTGMSSDSLKDNAFFTDNIAPEDIHWLSITALICLIAFMWLMHGLQIRASKSSDT